MKKTMQKLRSRAGMTIGETLVSMLVAALALTMLAGSMAAVSKVIERGRTGVNTYYDEVEEMVSMTGDSSVDKTVKFQDMSTGLTTKLEVEDQNVSCYSAELGNTTVVMYKRK